MVYTGNLAEQLINGVIRIVNKRSFRFSIFLALIIAGTAQAKPLIIGITLLPFNPTPRIKRSVRKLILAMYPVSSSKVINPNKIMICGTKTRIPLRPASNPCVSKLLHHASGSTDEREEFNIAKPESIQSIGYCANQKTL